MLQVQLTIIIFIILNLIIHYLHGDDEFLHCVNKFMAVTNSLFFLNSVAASIHDSVSIIIMMMNLSYRSHYHYDYDS